MLVMVMYMYAIDPHLTNLKDAQNHSTAGQKF